MVIQDEGHHFPSLVFRYLAFDLAPANLFVECVKQLLTCGRTGKRCAVMLCPAEAAKVEQSFRSSREGNAHAIEEINDRRGHFAHCLCRRLVCKKVATIDSVVKMLPGRIAFTLRINSAVYAALRANG